MLKNPLFYIISHNLDIFQFHSDDKIARAVIKHAELLSAYTDVYFYQFSYHGELGNNSIHVPGKLLRYRAHI